MDNSFSKEVISNKTECPKQILKPHKKHLNSTQNPGEIKLMMKFYLCFQNFSEFWIYFLRFPWEKDFGVISGNYFILSF